MSSSSGKRTFVVLDKDLAAENSKVLLGMVVANVRRPLDNYEPCRGPYHLAQPLPFLSDYTTTPKVESPGVISATAIRKGDALASLFGIFRFKTETIREQSFELRSETITTYAVENYGKMFEQLRDQYEDVINELARRAKNGIFMVVAYKTAIDATIVLDCKESDDNAGGVGVPDLPIGAVKPLAVLRPAVDKSSAQSWETSIRTTVEGERVFAVEYCELVETNLGISLGTRKVKKTTGDETTSILRFEKAVKTGGILSHGSRVLAFGTEEGDHEDLMDEYV